MSTSVQVLKSPGVWEVPHTIPLNEATWKAWVANGLARDRRSSAARVVALKCVLVAVLLLTAVLWSRLAQFEVFVRFIVSAGAMLLLAQAVQARFYAFAAAFAFLAWLYNPIAPVFSLAGDWQRAVVVASTVPFIASLGWCIKRQVHND